MGYKNQTCVCVMSVLYEEDQSVGVQGCGRLIDLLSVRYVASSSSQGFIMGRSSSFAQNLVQIKEKLRGSYVFVRFVERNLFVVRVI